MVPFGGAHHDWAALELGTCGGVCAPGAPLRLIGAASDDGADGRDASRLLADASLIVQRLASVVAEPLLARPGREGVFALAAGAGLLVVGLSDRWRDEGLGGDPRAARIGAARADCAGAARRRATGGWRRTIRARASAGR